MIQNLSLEDDGPFNIVDDNSDIDENTDTDASSDTDNDIIIDI